MAERFSIRIAVFVVFEKDGKILLSLRKNTGYHDGEYALVQGHVEAGEEIKAAAIREAKEEACVDVAPEDMCFAAVCHDQTELPYIHFIFKCTKWQGEIKNGEPNCCGGLEWFDSDRLPENMAPKFKRFINLPESVSLFELK